MDEVLFAHRDNQRLAEKEMWELSLFPELYPWAEAVRRAVHLRRAGHLSGVLQSLCKGLYLKGKEQGLELPLAQGGGPELL